MKFSRKQVFIIIGIVVAAVVLIFIFTSNLRSRNQPPPVTLNVWGFDSADTMSPILQGYKQLRPNVTLNYQQVSPDGYENNLLNALASGQGPDVFPVFNRSLPKNENKMYPVNPAQFSLSQLRSDFPQVIEDDFAVASGTAGDKSIYALPLYVDSLSLIYNKDLFDGASIVAPPKTWDDFQNDIAPLRSVNQSGQIAQAAAAIGGSEKTIPNAIDILNNLMLQNGTQMFSGNQAYFASDPSNAGINAFNFYLQFVNPSSQYYTWSDNGSDDVGSFASGKTAMIFGYHSVLNDIKTKNPFLNFAVALMPQPSLPAGQMGTVTPVTYASYWGMGVAKQSQNPAWAWDFVLYATDNIKAAQNYFKTTGNPPALRSLIQQELNDQNYGVFAKEALTDRSWYEADNNVVDQIFNQAIAGVLNGQFSSEKALANAQDQVNQLMRQ